MSDNYTPDELEALPQSDMVFERPDVNLNDHVLVQENYMIIDRCPSHPAVSFNIPNGKLLVKHKGEYSLVDERVS